MIGTFFFFILPDKKNLSIYDCNYSLNDKIVFDSKKMTVGDFIKSLYGNGNEIGLHGSFLTYDNYELLEQQQNILENIIEDDVISIRQHYLHYDIKKTKDIHNKLFKIDTTIGFNTDYGFRAGTCMPYYISENVLEVPLNIMDSSLYSEVGLNVDIDTSKQHILSIMQKVQEIGGVLTVNFHLDYIDDKSMLDMLEFVITEARNRNAYFANLETIKKIIDKCVA